LIDEIGMGTDPTLGGALAQSILQYLHRKGASGIVTTHIDILKKMADSTEGIQNGAMTFNINKLEPTYKLKTGIPGNSFTFEIASRIGIPDDIIENAKTFAGKDRISFEEKISEINKKEGILIKSIEKQKMSEDFFEELINKYRTLISRIEDDQKDIIFQTKLQSEEILSKANKLIENTIQQIRLSQADKVKTKELRKEIEEFKTEIKNITPKRTVSKKLIEKVDTKPIVIIPTKKIEWKEGMYVKYKKNNEEGIIDKILKDNQLKIKFHSITINLNSDELIPLNNLNTSKKRNYNRITNSNTKSKDFRIQIDIRGKRAEEIIELIEKHIDDALIIGVYNFSILHGKGNGILRTIARQILSKHSNVEQYESEHIERGGDGITLVKLKK
jgi:DNA mismatch repair protein MutS2